MRQHMKTAGFTLMEMMIVLVVIGVVVAFAAPKIDVTKFRVESSMQGVGMTMLAVERQAITQQHDEIVMFDVAKNLIRIHEDANNNGAIDAGERVHGVPLGEGIVFGRATAPARPMGPGPVTFTKVAGGLPAVVFHRDGSASEAGGFYLTSTRAATAGTHLDDTRSVELERATGRASWYKFGPPSTWRRAF
ncbi:MAG TPA: prepilin-type N-terminal cleavage/methylation domain-containing protein [Gemmatimonadales bacterium]